MRVSCKCCVEKRDAGVRLDIATQLDSLFFSLLVVEVHPSYFIRNNYVMILLRNGRKSVGQIQKPPLTNVVLILSLKKNPRFLLVNYTLSAKFEFTLLKITHQTHFHYLYVDDINNYM